MDGRTAAELVKQYIQLNSCKPGKDRAVVVGTGIAVWELVEYSRSVNGSRARVAERYGLPVEAVEAAMAYYQGYRAIIDSRIDTTHTYRSAGFISASFREALAQVRAGNPVDLETVIEFLEADPWGFGTGYDKEYILRALLQYELTEAQQRRLQNVILHVVDTRATREFREYSKLARKVDGPSLREGLLKRLRSDDEGIARRALWALSYLPDLQLTPNDLKCARAVLLREAANHAAGIFGWNSGWENKLSRKYWEAELRELAKKENRQGAAARSILSSRGLRLKW